MKLKTSRKLSRFLPMVAGVCVVMVQMSMAPAMLFADAAQAKAEFDKVYGEAVRGVKGTRSSADDAKLAKVLFDAASQASSEPYKILLLEQAYDFGKLHTDGMRAAADALQMLAEVEPRRQLEAQEKLLALYEIVFRNAASKSDKTQHKKLGAATTDLMVEIAQAKGKRAEYNAAVMMLRKATSISRTVAYNERQDDITDMIRDMTPLAPIDSKVQVARRALGRDPADKGAAKTLTELYLKELDRPLSAKTYAELVEEAAALERYSLAGKPVDSLSAEEASQLGAWYLELAGDGTANAKTNMLIRAKVYLEHALMKKPDDAQAKANATKVDLTLTALKVDSAKATELAKSRRDRLGITVAARTVKPKPEPEPKPEVKPEPKPDPVAPVPAPQPVKPDPKPADPPPAMAVEPEPKEVEPEFREEELSDDYWRNRKSIFDF